MKGRRLIGGLSVAPCRNSGGLRLWKPKIVDILCLRGLRWGRACESIAHDGVCL